MRETNRKILIRNSGITLIALVVTIIVLLILAGVSINLVVGNNGIISKAIEAKNATLADQENTQIAMNSLYDEIENAVGGTTGGGSNEGDETGGSTDGVKVTIDGETVTLTEENYADYLGKIVTNYKTVGGTETVTVDTANYDEISEFTVSTTYRLYYIDFANKYGDGAGTIYLKADCTANHYTLSVGKDYNEENMKNLNPSLYASGVTAPTSTNNNMKAVTWLLDKDEWSGLVESGTSTEIASKVKYVVGAPSLEMMMDSFNTHYRLTGDTPDYSARTAESERTKLFYKYTSGGYGYQVGPAADDSSEYYYWTSYYSVQSDSEIDSMYNPGTGQYYWLASPSARGSGYVLYVNNYLDGRMTYGYYYSNHAFCPLVSLQSDVQLTLSSENI